MIKEHVQLAPLSTLQVGGEAAYLVEVTSEAELQTVVSYAKERALPIRVLGGGSNVLIPDDGIPGLVIKIGLMGRVHTIENETAYVTVGAGEVLDNVVAYTVDQGWWGIENLSHIPGSVGATPVQNVGAYGVEVKDVITSVRVLDIATATFKTLTPEECAFGYRDSVFKHEAGSRYVVTAVTFTLSLAPQPRLSYKDLSEHFAGVEAPSLAKIRDAIIDIRSKKFPDWHSVGTAGSFFKNPIISKETYASLHKKYPGLPGFALADGTVKVPLGWILDKVLNARGVTEGHVGTFVGQALVIVNHGGATAAEIAAFADRLIAHVKERTGITVEWEVTRW